MVYFFVLGEKRGRCETRLVADENGFELVITDSPGEDVEEFGATAGIFSLRRP